MSLKGSATPEQILVGRINRLNLLTISAYGIAVKNGFEGTEQEWLASLEANPDRIQFFVEEYLKKNPTTVDTTLTESGMAADAKSTGEAIAKTASDITALAKSTEEAIAKTGSDIADLAKNIFVVSDTAPAKGPALWFNTAPGGGVNMESHLLLDDDENGYDVQAVVGNAVYGVGNMSVNQGPTESGYDFTVL